MRGCVYGEQGSGRAGALAKPSNAETKKKNENQARAYIYARSLPSAGTYTPTHTRARMPPANHSTTGRRRCRPPPGDGAAAATTSSPSSSPSPPESPTLLSATTSRTGSQVRLLRLNQGQSGMMARAVAATPEP